MINDCKQAVVYTGESLLLLSPAETDMGQNNISSHTLSIYIRV